MKESIRMFSVAATVLLPAVQHCTGSRELLYILSGQATGKSTCKDLQVRRAGLTIGPAFTPKAA